MMAQKVKITQVRSIIGSSRKQKATIRALGLRRIRHSVVHEETPQILGMIHRVVHLVKSEAVKD